MIRQIAFLLVSAFVLTGCVKDFSEEGGATDTGDITLSFSSVVRNQPLDFTSTYTNAWGESYSVTTFKYYIHNISLLTSEGTSLPVSSAYFLVDESQPLSKQMKFKARSGDYTRLSFTLGVDSTENVSGAQSGMLDPTNGMFWTWSSGYVMAKLEGLSTAAVTSANGNFSYHVGGFKQPDVATKQIRLDVPVSSKLLITKGSNTIIDLSADINTWFSRVNPIKIAEYPAVHSPGFLARQIADNYEGMFTISGIR